MSLFVDFDIWYERNRYDINYDGIKIHCEECQGEGVLDDSWGYRDCGFCHGEGHYDLEEHPVLEEDLKKLAYPLYVQFCMDITRQINRNYPKYYERFTHQLNHDLFKMRMEISEDEYYARYVTD